MQTTHQNLENKGFSLELNGGVWQYRSRSKFIRLDLNNSYSEKEVIKMLIYELLSNAELQQKAVKIGTSRRSRRRKKQNSKQN